MSQTPTDSASTGKSVGADGEEQPLSDECEECGAPFASEQALQGHQSKHSDAVDKMGRPEADQ